MDDRREAQVFAACANDRINPTKLITNLVNFKPALLLHYYPEDEKGRDLKLNENHRQHLFKIPFH